MNSLDKSKIQPKDATNSEPGIRSAGVETVTAAQSGEAALEATVADVGTLRDMLKSALVTAISAVSEPNDRDEVIRWFVRARAILATGQPPSVVASELYAILDSGRMARLVANTAATTFYSYSGSGLPWSIKAALPVAILGTAFLGVKGAGIAAFGGAVGLPVVVLMFLGTAGVTAIIEALLKNNEVTDPLTNVLISLMRLEQKRRASKELLRALREETTVPKRQELPENDQELIEAMRAMPPTDFERHVMSLFEADGCPAAVTQQSNDFGVDGFVTYPDGIVVVQCKRHRPENPVGRPTVQQFKGVIEEQNAVRGYIVTTSRFTQEALTSAEKSGRVVLIDFTRLIEWHRTGMVPKN